MNIMNTFLDNSVYVITIMQSIPLGPMEWAVRLFWGTLECGLVTCPTGPNGMDHEAAFQKFSECSLVGYSIK